MRSFSDFAYFAPNGETHPPVFLPTKPWTSIKNLSPELDIESETSTYGFDVAFSRFSQNQQGSQQELWIATLLTSIENPRSSTAAIYYPSSGEVTTIDTQIVNTDLFVYSLILASDNTVWGKVLSPIGEKRNQSSIPVMAKFNEQIQRFEFVSGMVTTDLNTNELNTLSVKSDPNGGFWIFMAGRVYFYSDTDSASEEVASLDSFAVDSAHIVDNQLNFVSASFASIETGARLYTLDTNTRELTSSALTSERWPGFSGLVIDSERRIWLGATGIRNVNGSWNLLHPNPALYFNNLGVYFWSPPTLMLQSTDGRLWFNRFQDTGGWVDGTAWYDPNTGEGCQVTNIAANIIEDDQGTLWMVADGVLYSYTLPN